MNLTDAILYHCRLNPFAMAICTPGSAIASVRYGQLQGLIHSVARSASKAGLQPKQTVAIHVSDTILHAVLALGLMRIGVATMSLREPHLPKAAPVDGIVTDRPPLFAGASNVLAVDMSWLQSDPTALNDARLRGEEHDLCRLEFANTADASSILAITHQSLGERLAHYRIAKGGLFARVARLFSTFDVSSAPGFNYMLYMLSQGDTIYFPGSDPTAILQYLAPYKVQALATSESELERLLQPLEDGDTLEYGFDAVLCHGVSPSHELATRARIRLGANFNICYEPAETSTVAFGQSVVASRITDGQGFVCPGAIVDTLDPDGAPMPIGHEGTIRIRTPGMCSDYVGNPEASKQAFRSGGFCPGDVGYTTHDGLLVVTGAKQSTRDALGPNDAG